MLVGDYKADDGRCSSVSGWKLSERTDSAMLHDFTAHDQNCE